MHNHNISYTLLYSGIVFEHAGLGLKSRLNTDIKMLSALTLPVVKLVAVSWTHGMTGVILYLANTDT